MGGPGGPGGGQGGRWFNSEPVVLHKTTNAFKLGQVRRRGGQPVARHRLPPSGPRVPACSPTPSPRRRAEALLSQVRTDDPEEEARQKQFKSILNKLTPENFDKLLPKLLAVEIPRLLTLQGLVDQIFDKALLEPTFSELYALLCQRMQESRKLPQFDETGEVMDEASGVKPAHDFRKTLLAKCQTEFEAGTRARKEHYDETHKVKASEVRGRSHALPLSLPPGTGTVGTETGRVKTPWCGSQEAEEDPKAKALREAENLQARKRMLGNIKFIGHLFQHKMLIESIMVTCIKTLLANVEEPEPEDVEALCRLLSTVGGMLDTGNNGKMMDVFFIRVQKLRENERLESRIRFMLQDIIELR